MHTEEQGRDAVKSVELLFNFKKSVIFKVQ